MARHKCEQCGSGFYGYKRKLCRKCNPKYHSQKLRRSMQIVTKVCLYCREPFKGNLLKKYHLECAKIIQRQREKDFYRKEKK